MKVRLLPLAIAAAVAAPGVALADAPTVYGKMNVAYGMTTYDFGGDNTFGVDSADHWDLTSYDSRVGVKGEEKISDDLAVIYQAEFGVYVDDGDDKGQVFSQRNILAGLKGGWGTLQAGRFDSPLKAAQGKIDQFGDTSGDLKYAFLGENRVDNIVQYTTPAMSGFTAALAILPGEEYDYQDTGDVNDGPADAISMSASYTMEGLYLAVAHDSEVKSSYYSEVKNTLDGLSSYASAEPFDATRLVAVYAMDAFQVGAMYQMAETSDPKNYDDLEQDGFLLSGSYKIDAIKLKLQYAATTATNNDVEEEIDATLLGAGAEYALSKQTNLYVHYTTVSYESDAVGADTQSFDKFDVGMVVNF